MRTKKNTGSYYTPEFLSGFIMERLSAYFQGRKYLSVLEPSVGDGSFITAFNRTHFPDSIKGFSFHAIEKAKPELEKAQEKAIRDKKKNTKFSFEAGDFLESQKTARRKFSLVIGNPPYIKKSLLRKRQIEFCKIIHEEAGLGKGSVKNIWPYFLLKGVRLLDRKGVLAYILPAELLQVDFSTELRRYLVDNFERTEIFTFDDLLFDCKGQDTVLLIAYKKHWDAGQFFTHISDTKQLKSGDFELKKNVSLVAREAKWTHHLLSADELDFIFTLKKSLQPVNYFCTSKPGIVTAANAFFIVSSEIEDKYKLTKFLKPIIQKGFYVNGSVVFDTSEYFEILEKGNPGKLLAISDNDVRSLPSALKKYLQVGVDLELPKGHKCSRRKNWFVVPNISTTPDGFFFRRVHYYPKLLKNSAQVLVTDTAYKIDMRPGFSIENLIFSFYNSLSLLFSEISGRYYGGGVLEVTPQEFKSIPIPYINFTTAEFDKFAALFKEKTSINDMLSIYDYGILNKSLSLTTEDTRKIQAIYGKLLSKRLRKL